MLLMKEFDDKSSSCSEWSDDIPAGISFRRLWEKFKTFNVFRNFSSSFAGIVRMWLNEKSRNSIGDLNSKQVNKNI